LDSDDEKMETSASVTAKKPSEVKKESVSPLKKETTVKQEPRPEIKVEVKQELKQEVKEEIKEQPKKSESEAQNELWVEKYKPKAMNKIIGQSTEKSNANKLLNWLRNWEKWHGTHSDKTKKPWNDQETGSSFKAALLSGPPGIGKTTTANLVCKEAGFTFIELNASDSRSKKLLSSVLGKFNLVLLRKRNEVKIYKLKKVKVLKAHRLILTLRVNTK
jgi:replication factor C subunit 1